MSTKTKMVIFRATPEFCRILKKLEGKLSLDTGIKVTRTRVIEFAVITLAEKEFNVPEEEPVYSQEEEK